jgi:hypothetical protein
MQYNEFGPEQASAMRIAVDTALTWLGGGNSESWRTEIARIVLSIAREGDYSAAELAELTIEKIAERERKTA